MNFDQYKDYAILLQENHYFGQFEYLNMMQKEHERLKEQNGLTSEQIKQRGDTGGEKLSLSLNHFYHSQPKKLV